MEPFTIISNYNKINGGYLYLIRDRRTFSSNVVVDNKNKKEFTKDVQDVNFFSLYNLIKNFPKTYFIVTRMPMHHSYQGFSNEDDFSVHINALMNLKNASFVDFAHYILPDSCFGDNEHLNHYGASMFTPIFLEKIRTISP